MFKYLLVLPLLFQSLIADGFKNANVLTSQGYVSVAKLKEGHKVLSAQEDGSIVEKSIEKIRGRRSRRFYTMHLEGDEANERVIAKWGQFFVNAQTSQWVNVAKLKAGDELRTLTGNVKIQSIKRVKRKFWKKYYKITVPDNHNFFISKHNILSHNFAIAITLVAMPTLWEGLLILAGIVGWSIFDSYCRDRGLSIPATFKIGPGSKYPHLDFNGGNFNLEPKHDPDDDDDKKKEGKAQRDLKQEKVEDEEFLRENGFKQTKDFRFNSRGNKVYQKGRVQISRDADAHKGGHWKMYRAGTERRLGTYNKDLTEKIGN